MSKDLNDNKKEGSSKLDGVYNIDETDDNVEPPCGIFTGSLEDLVDDMKIDITEKLDEMYIEEIDKIEFKIFKMCKESGYSTSDTALEMDNIKNDITGIIQGIIEVSVGYGSLDESVIELFTAYFGRWVNHDYPTDLSEIQ